jgi:hypothetical protein
MLKAGSLAMKFEAPKAIAAMIPAAIASPVFASDVTVIVSSYLHPSLTIFFLSLSLIDRDPTLHCRLW